MNFITKMTKGGWKGVFQGLGMKLSESKPEIMLCTGGISMIIGTIYACYVTDKAKEAVKEAKDDIKNVEEALQLPDDENIDILPETKRQFKFEKGRQYARIYGKLLYKMGKIYGIPAVLWFTGWGLVCKSHGELRHMNSSLAADIFAGRQLLQGYRERVAQAVGEETEQKIFMGMQEGMVKVLETDENTGERKVIERKADVFYAQPGSIFARNYNEETSDAFDIRSFADHYLDQRIDEINMKLALGLYRAMNGIDILRTLGFNENALGDDDSLDQLLHYGISGNAKKVPDPEMRKLKVTRLRGYQKKWDQEMNMEVFVPCLRLDFNFYPLEGKI